MPRTCLREATALITELAVQHPDRLPEALASALGVRRRTALGLCNRLAALQWLVRAPGRGRRRFSPGLQRQVVRRYALTGLREDTAWRHDFAPYFDVPAHVLRMAQYMFTELLNNAADHSGGSAATVSMRQTPNQLQLLVSDNGRGVFDAIGQHFQIDDPVGAMLALAKGKLSTQPDRHTGRGLFYAARLADVFDLHANGAAFQRRAWQPERWQPGRAVSRQGSSVYAAMALETTRTLDEVMRSHSLDGQGYGLERTVVPLALLTSDQVGLESRAMARQVAAHLPGFVRAELDFSGLQEVGHAFVDELWRVFGARQPGLQLVPVNMAPRVAAMVNSVRVQPAATALKPPGTP